MVATHDQDGHHGGGPWRLLADNSLTLALFTLFLICLAAQSLTGWCAYDESLQAAHKPLVGYVSFLLTGTFQNAIFSNWQAAVLQLAAGLPLLGDPGGMLVKRGLLRHV